MKANLWREFTYVVQKFNESLRLVALCNNLSIKEITLSGRSSECTFWPFVVPLPISTVESWIVGTRISYLGIGLWIDIDEVEENGSCPLSLFICCIEKVRTSVGNLRICFSKVGSQIGGTSFQHSLYPQYLLFPQMAYGS